MFPSDAAKTVKLYHLPTTAGQTQAYPSTQSLKVTGFVNAVPGFAQHPEVINGASDTFVQVFGDAGKHARAAVGAGSLPRNVAVEVEAIFEIV